MLKSQKNSILLVAFHLAVLLSPLLAKGFHHHENTRNYNIIHHEKTVSQAPNHCYICDFEYVNVISPEFIKLPSVFAANPIQNTILERHPHCEFVHYYSLRAPPTC
jgi:hypothetical protein